MTFSGPDRDPSGWSACPAVRLAYERMLGRSLNDSAFRRKIDELRVIDAVHGATSKATARPAQLFRLSHPQLSEFDRTL